MIPRSLILYLVLALVLLLVAFAILMAFQLLLGALGDETAASALRWIAVGSLMLLVADLLVLVVALGIQASGDHPGQDPRD